MNRALRPEIFAIWGALPDDTLTTISTHRANRGARGWKVLMSVRLIRFQTTVVARVRVLEVRAETAPKRSCDRDRWRLEKRKSFRPALEKTPRARLNHRARPRFFRR